MSFGVDSFLVNNMNNKFCIGLLAFGKEHIEECNNLITNINNIDRNIKIYVVTDNGKLIKDVFKKIEIKDCQFNYNLKRVVIENALVDENIVMFLDTDTKIEADIDFSLINGIGENEIYIVFEHKELNNTNTFLNQMNKKYNTKLGGIGEHCFIISNGDKTKKLLNIWEKLDNESREIQTLHLGKKGTCEGVLMWLSIEMSKIKKIKNGHIQKKIFSKILHFNQPIKKII